MSDPIIPTPQDKQLLLEDTITKTATFAGTVFDLGVGFAPGGMGRRVAVVVEVGTADFASGNESYTFVLQESPDNADFTSIGASTAVSGTGTLGVSGVVRHRYLRLYLSAGGTTPSITYKASLNPLP